MSVTVRVEKDRVVIEIETPQPRASGSDVCGALRRWPNRIEGDDVSVCTRAPHGLTEQHEGPTQRATLMTWSS